MPSPCPGPSCAAEVNPNPTDPAAQGLRTVYLNFDGLTLEASSNNDDARNNVSAILSGAVAPGQSRSLPPFDPFDLWSTEGLSRAQIIQRVVNDLYELHSPYNIEFVTERPSSGSYHMIVFSGDCPSVAGQQGCAGIALLDCGDYLPNNIVFVFPDGLRVGDLAATAAQEAAHAFGLSHTLDTTDVMYPQIQDSIPQHFGSGQVPQTDDPCSGGDYQDSHEMMMSTIGFRGQDTVPPAVSISEPRNGAVVDAGTSVLASVEDGATIVSADLMINGEVVASKSAPAWAFQIPDDAPAGDLLVTVRAFDDSDNMGFDRISVYRPSGEEQTCAVDEECGGGFECTDMLCVPEDGIDGELGDICVDNPDCFSGQCATSDGESRCSQSCDADNPCPGGFECRGGVACWPVDMGTGAGGCSLGGEGGAAGGATLLLFALLATRRPRRAR